MKASRAGLRNNTPLSDEEFLSSDFFVPDLDEQSDEQLVRTQHPDGSIEFTPMGETNGVGDSKTAEHLRFLASLAEKFGTKIPTARFLRPVLDGIIESLELALETLAISGSRLAFEVPRHEPKMIRRRAQDEVDTSLYPPRLIGYDECGIAQYSPKKVRDHSTDWDNDERDALGNWKQSVRIVIKSPFIDIPRSNVEFLEQMLELLLKWRNSPTAILSRNDVDFHKEKGFRRRAQNKRHKDQSPSKKSFKRK